MHTSRIFLLVLLYTSFTVATPWPALVEEGDVLVVRQQGVTLNPDQASVTQSHPGNSTSSTAVPNGNSTITKSQPHTSSGNHTGTSTTSAQPTSIDPRLPAGGIQMLHPAPTDPTTYYKIGNEVTFQWNYTSLIASPTAIDVLVTCTGNGATYTLANNVSIQATGAVVWNTSEDRSGDNPLLTDQYTLIIHDASEAVTSVPEAGHLAVFNQFSFGMYIPQTSQDLSEFVCATCSGAVSDMERQALKFLFGMCLLTIFSFSWFAGGFLA